MISSVLDAPNKNPVQTKSLKGLTSGFGMSPGVSLLL